LNLHLVSASAARSVRLVLTFVLGLLLALACLSAFSSDAQAVSNTERFRFFSDFCVSERAQIYDWSRDGRLYGQSVTRPLRGDCSTPLSAPPGYVWSRVNVEKWSPYYGEYLYCTGTQWYNSSWTSKHVVYVGLGPQYNRTCGSGWYRTKAWGSVWVYGGWRSTPWVNSGGAYFW
jgi:hypothetical protein